MKAAKAVMVDGMRQSLCAISRSASHLSGGSKGHVVDVIASSSMCRNQPKFGLVSLTYKGRKARPKFRPSHDLRTSSNSKSPKRGMSDFSRSIFSLPGACSGTTIRRHTMSPYLPPEVIDLVFNHLEDIKRALSVCRLVCRSWSDLARPRLFHTLTWRLEGIYPYMDVTDFLSISREIAIHVRSLVVGGSCFNGPGHSHVLDLDKLYSILASSLGSHPSNLGTNTLASTV